MSQADDLADDVLSLRSVANDLALPDFCDVLRRQQTGLDTRGNPVMSDAVTSSARCRLRTGGTQPQERAAADLIEATAPYAIDLPYDHDLVATDLVQVNSTRRFEVIGVLQDERFGIFTTAIVEERL